MYKHWRGLFYPERLPVKRWFAWYADSFDTVEINNSFYRLPPASTFEAWRRQAPEGFCYAVKANRFITQAKKLKDCEEPLVRMMDAVKPLDGALGPMLYQLPPRFKVNLDRLESFLALLPPGVTNVFEFREQSWYCDEVFALLGRYGASFCVHDMPGNSSPREAVGPIAYIRFHGGTGKYSGRYPDERLLAWTDWMVEQASKGRALWAYFNNDIGAAAIEDAQTLRAMIRQKLPPKHSDA
ncbi:histidine kinase [Tsuneonella deserti]|uniref:Histidine kinase n=2 Tax=Tsuneonella deserti TaxID=2035528 RepID=A0ABQ1S348_9SPHN|nr:histidine kinase [Tsuneonella deserti]